MQKISIRFFEKTPIRTIWDDENSKWLFCATDIIEALKISKNSRIYWAKFKSRKKELLTNCQQLKLKARDGKFYNTDVIDEYGINSIVGLISKKNQEVFLKWMKSMETSLDEKSKKKAYELFETNFIEQIEVGTVKGLQQIHSYIFGGLYDFAGQIRTLNISKDGFVFAQAKFLKNTLKTVEKLPENTLEEIINKYVEMNIAHPFMEGNGRSTRIWLVQILKKNLGVCVDWSKIDKTDYFVAMRASVVDSSKILSLIQSALTKNTTDREIIMKGIDYSYYYEEPIN